jgi:hypothetical protein
MTGVFWIIFWGGLLLYGLVLIALAWATDDVGVWGGVAGLVLVVSGVFWIVQEMMKRGR